MAYLQTIKGFLNPVAFLKWLYWRYLRLVFSELPVAFINAVMSLLARLQMASNRQRKLVTLEELFKSGLIDETCNMRETLHVVFQTQLNSWAKLCYLQKINSSNVDDYVAIEGAEHLDNALRGNRGALLLNSHFGPYMMSMPALGYRGYRVNQVAIQGDPPTVGRKGFFWYANEAKFQAVEKLMPVNFINASIPVGDKNGLRNMSMRDIILALQRNEFVLFPATGRGGRKWVQASFLGRTVNFNISPFKLAIKTGTALLPVFLIDLRDGIAKMVVEPPIDVSENDTSETLLDKYLAVVSRYVKHYPEQFAYFLYEMKMKSWWDDHPFFTDYKTSRVFIKKT
ncbi:MAG: lysophospholipid acyltransferase family protein [Nitrospirae bacterium]|nr:lysophospholipid acyltransferase family protein [Nitrospirota bacterium]MBF0533641.1 lysophospholipid acyltransferase family protein [Nitrospirota bacterium]MBF0616708.1 lysophospholipid acyltransferase family protein [Nitrospirota bacterium]